MNSCFNGSPTQKQYTVRDFGFVFERYIKQLS
ncbi:YvbH-like oligomerization domain-containing protein [Parageobacillus thermantarcticus]